MENSAKVTTTLEEAHEAGLLGVEVDPTPNEHYTVAGVIAGKPTPETDADAAAAAGATFGRAAAAPAGSSSSSSNGKSAKDIAAGIGADTTDDELNELAEHKTKTVRDAVEAERARREGGAS